MNNKNKNILFAIPIILSPLFFYIYSKKGIKEEAYYLAHDASSSTLHKNDVKDNTQFRTTESTHNALRTSEALLSKYVKQSKGLKGQDLINLQYTLAKEAMSCLEGLEMLRFIEFMSNEGSSQATDFLISAANLTATTDRETVRSHILEMQNTSLQVKLLRNIGRDFTDIDEAGNYLSKISNSEGKNAFITSYCLGSIAARPPSELVDQYLSLSEGCFSSTSLENFIKMLPRNTNFSDVLDLLQANAPIENQNQLLSRTLITWAGHDPQSAADYILVNKKNLQITDIKNIVKSWVQISPSDAERWYNECADNQAKDFAAVELANFYTDSNRDKAISFAKNINDYEVKLKTATQIFHAWAKTDPVTAEKAWIEVFAK
jgi:hypothetical protein